MASSVPYRKLSPTALSNHLNILRKGNTLLKMGAEMLGMKPKRLRVKILNGELDLDELTEDQREFMESALPCILEVRKVEWDMLCGFTALAFKLAKRWANDEVITADCLQEAHLGLLEAIWSYTRDDIAFNTYAWHAIKNHLISFMRRSRNDRLNIPNSPTLRNLWQFEKFKSTYNRPATDAEIIAQMRLSEKEAKLLQQALVKVIQFNEPGDGDPYDRQFYTGDNNHTDYTAFRRGLLKEDNTIPCHHELLDAVERAGLTEMEREIIDATMHPYYGWKTQIAKRYINPTTGKPFHKQAIQGMLDKALDKIKSVYRIAS